MALTLINALADKMTKAGLDQQWCAAGIREALLGFVNL
jgi:hypothetical protein